MSKSIEKALADETSELVRQITLQGVDGIIGGWPCQDASVAAGAKATGIEGERTGLWRFLFRAIRLVRPKIALLENVAMLLENVAMLLDRGVGAVFGDLASIGYDCEWHCIRADAVGLPHKRPRFYAVAYPSGQRLQRHFPQEIQGQPEVIRQIAASWGENEN